jgi:hypothetical protein
MVKEGFARCFLNPHALRDVRVSANALYGCNSPKRISIRPADASGFIGVDVWRCGKCAPCLRREYVSAEDDYLDEIARRSYEAGYMAGVRQMWSGQHVWRVVRTMKDLSAMWTHMSERRSRW